MGKERQDKPISPPLAEGFGWGTNSPSVTEAQVAQTKTLLETASGVTIEDFGVNARRPRRGRTKPVRRIIGETVDTMLSPSELKTLIVSPIREIPWRLALPEAVREVIEIVARQAGVPVSLIEGTDFMTEIDELGGRNLRGLLVYGERLKDNIERTAVGKLFKRAEIKTSVEDLKQAREVKREIHWKQIQSETIVDILRITAELNDKPILELSKEDLEKEYPELGFMNLSGLYYNALRSSDRKGLEPMTHLFVQLGLIVMPKKWNTRLGQ